MEIEVKGHSGCQINVVNEDGGIYVYKSTADPKYLQRLALQAKKQMAAAGVEYQHIRVPKVYELQENADTTIIKMQYVYSKNFIEFFEQAGFEQVDYLIGALEYFVEHEISKCELQKVSSSIFQEKFADIRAKVESNPLYNENQNGLNRLNPAIADLMTRSQTVFDNLKEMTIPVGVCHGDLTFSNILFNGNNYYLIDFLDSFIETPLQDIVKIRQDTAYRWSQLMYTKKYDAVRLRIVCDKIDREIDQYFTRKYQWYTDNYRVMQLMNILRILPYAHEEKVVSYLVQVLNDLLSSVEGETRNEKGCEGNENREMKNEKCTNDNPSPERTLIMPIAADKSEYKTRLPRVFLIAEDGVMHCIRALKSLNLSRYDHIYITILRHLDEKYALSERLILQFRINGITNAEIVVLDQPTTSQPDTIYQTILQKNIHGSIFVKDADCSFCGEDTIGNAIAIHPLEELDWVNPKNKSYVSIDDMYYITNIIEKRIVFHFFTAGGYSFESADTYCRYYEQFQQQPGLYLSHIIYSMLLDKHTFRPVLTKEYEDFEFKFEKK
jgi:aminoglycoside phosphotransferase